MKNNDNKVFNPLSQLPYLPQEWSALGVECSAGIRKTRQNFIGEEMFIRTAWKGFKRDYGYLGFNYKLITLTLSILNKRIAIQKQCQKWEDRNSHV